MYAFYESIFIYQCHSTANVNRTFLSLYIAVSCERNDCIYSMNGGRTSHLFRHLSFLHLFCLGPARLSLLIIMTAIYSAFNTSLNSIEKFTNWWLFLFVWWFGY